MKLTRYEEETIINFNAGDQTATLYTRDPAIMRKVDELVIVSQGGYLKNREKRQGREYMPSSNVEKRIENVPR